MASKTSCTYICCAGSNVSTMVLDLATMTTAGCQAQPCTPASHRQCLCQIFGPINFWKAKKKNANYGNSQHLNWEHTKSLSRVFENGKSLVIQMKSSITFQFIDFTFQDQAWHFVLIWNSMSISLMKKC